MQTPIQGEGTLVGMRFRYHEPVGKKGKLYRIEEILSSRNNYRQTGEEMKLIAHLPHIFDIKFHQQKLPLRLAI